ncbi:hypothetical protein EDD18DRAFT_1429821 [Armillaria luteobubalina]|uniref:P-type ATPase C-terminal domain-containing protein n=1 Tax=Armillaria luteobubalina TaxID=153913 RepID=A0AA39ULX9_9AGAR|nr:hypothetical protein EDD18DRAFT_1429821 [Armillaria luteobubalina]
MAVKANGLALNGLPSMCSTVYIKDPEFSITMVLSAIIVVNLFIGMNTNVWTGWVFFAVLIGTILIWLYTFSHDPISSILLFRSTLFWLSLPITVCLSLVLRYITKAWKFGFAPDDIDILRYIRKVYPGRDLRSMHHEEGIGLQAMKRPVYGDDLVHRGFGFATEEGGVTMSRIQSHLSEKRMSSRNLTEFSRTVGQKSGKKSVDQKRSHDSDGPHHSLLQKGLRKFRPTFGSENQS